MFNVIDMHCDTIPAMYELSENGRSVTIAENQFQIDLNKLEKGHYLCQCFSLFTDLGALKERGVSPFEHVSALAKFWQQQIGRYPERIRQIRSYQELMENREAGRIGAVMTVEEGGVYEGDIDNLYRLYDMGVRISTLTWNYVNELGYPNPRRIPGECWRPDMEHGLTQKGIDFVEEMERMGILIDISHLNDAGIRDVFEHTKGPVIATHSNARAVCSHLRNLSDDVIRQIAERGGVTGINFYPDFLQIQDECSEDRLHMASALDMVRHMKYLKNLGGIDCIALGTDFDGYDGRTDIADAGEMQHLADVMSMEGFTDSEIEKVFGGNVLRVFREIW